jgi:carbon starvation protein CstA
MISLESLIGIVEFFLLPLLFGVIFYFLISKISRAELNCVSPTPAIEKYDRTEYIPEKLIFPLSYFLVSTIGIPSILSAYFGLKFGIRALLPYIVFGSIFISFITNYISLFVSVKNEGKDLISILRKYAGERAGKIFLIFSIINLLALFFILTDAVSGIFLKYPQILYSVGISVFLYAILGIIRQTSQTLLGISIVLSVLVFAISFILGQTIYHNIPYQNKILGSETIQIFIILYILTISLIPYWGGTKIKSTSHLISLAVVILIGCILAMKNIINTPQTFTEKILRPAIVNENDIFPSMFILAISASWGGFNSIILSSIVSKRIRSYCNIPSISFLGSISGMLFSIAVIITVIPFANTSKQISYEKFIESFISSFFELFPQNIKYKIIEEFLAYSFISFTLLSQEVIGRSLRLLLKESFISKTEKEQNENSIKTQKKGIKILKAETIMLAIATVIFFIEKEKTDKIWLAFGTSGYILLLLSSITSYIFLRKNKTSILTKTLKFFSILLFIFSSVVIFSFLAVWIKNYDGIAMAVPTIALLLILYVISVIVKTIRMRES